MPGASAPRDAARPPVVFFVSEGENRNNLFNTFVLHWEALMSEKFLQAQVALACAIDRIRNSERGQGSA